MVGKLRAHPLTNFRQRGIRGNNAIVLAGGREGCDAVGPLALIEPAFHDFYRRVLPFGRGSFDSRYLKLRLEEEEDRAKRYGGVTSLLCIDVGGLEETVSRHGKEGADAVLESFVATMLDELRRCDVLGRLAKNEFLAILPETDRRSARSVAERQRASVAELSFDCPDGGKVDYIRLNIGVAALPINGDTMTSVIAAARTASSRIKSSGANEVGVSEQFVKTDEIGQYIVEEVRGEKRDSG